ncbi:MAG: ABC transporter permease [Candidatus Binataceae bacterium]
MSLSAARNGPAGRAQPVIPAWQPGRGHVLLLVPPLLFLAIFFMWPLVRVVLRSFMVPTPGVQNYTPLLSHSLYAHVLLNTVEAAAIVTVLCLLLAYPIAYAIVCTRGVTPKLIAAVVIVSLWTSAVIRSYAWMILFQRRGVINDLLLASGVISKRIDFLPGTFAVSVGMVHIMLPFMILPLAANMQTIDRSLLRAAAVLGANEAAAFRKVFFPLSLPGIYAGTTLVFMISLGFFITPALLGGPNDMMAAVLIEQQANELLNWGLASALATAFLVVVAIVYIIYLMVTRQTGRPLEA